MSECVWYTGKIQASGPWSFEGVQEMRMLLAAGAGWSSKCSVSYSGANANANANANTRAESTVDMSQV